MSFVDAVKSCLSQYVGFQGRARRSEYWYFCLFNVILGVVASIIAQLTGVTILSTLVTLALLLPGIAVDIRRMHDIGKSGWWILISFVPVVGAILLIVWCCKDSEPGENQYGPNPKF